MALKDWKKLVGNPKTMAWYKKNEVMAVENAEKGSNNKYTLVFYSNGELVAYNNKFKTKSNALKEARAYMRTH